MSKTKLHALSVIAGLLLVLGLSTQVQRVSARTTHAQVRVVSSKTPTRTPTAKPTRTPTATPTRTPRPTATPTAMPYGCPPEDEREGTEGDSGEHQGEDGDESDRCEHSGDSAIVAGNVGRAGARAGGASARAGRANAALGTNPVAGKQAVVTGLNSHGKPAAKVSALPATGGGTPAAPDRSPFVVLAGLLLAVLCLVLGKRVRSRS